MPMMSKMANGLKDAHDRMLREKPESASHEPDGCPFCAMTEETMSDTYTEDDVRAKVEEAVKAATEPLEAKLAELDKARATNETETAVAAAVSEKDAEIAEVRKELDEATIKAKNATDEHEALVAWLDSEKVKAEEAAAISARKGERLSKLKEVASFPDDYLDKNADRFAAMSDEDFEARCAEYAALGGKPAPTPTKEIPSGTSAFTAGQEGSYGSGGQPSATRDLMTLRRDPRGHVPLSSLH